MIQQRKDSVLCAHEIQWNPSNADTIATTALCLDIEVSAFRRLPPSISGRHANAYSCCLETVHSRVLPCCMCWQEG